MNLYEWCVYYASCVSLAGYVYWRFRSWRDVVVLVGLCCGPLYLSLEGTSQFITCDENYSIHQIARRDRRDFMERELRHGACRTTLGILPPILPFVQRDQEWPSVQATTVLKLSHWVTGWLSFLWIVHLLLAVNPCPAPRLLFVAAFGLLLLPVSHMAFKTFNYDLLSMNLAVIALLQLVLAWQLDRPRLAWLAVAVATLAAQEKLIASPILLVAIIVAASVSLKQPGRSIWLRLPVNVLMGITMSWGIGLACVLVLRYSSGLGLGGMGALGRQGAEPLIVWGFGVLLFSVGTTNFTAYFPLLVAAAFVICLVGALVLFALSRPSMLDRLSAWGRWLPMAFGLLLAATVIVGLLGNYGVLAYWAPFRPIADGHYHPPGEINGTVLHFDAVTHGEHIRSFIGFAYAVFLDNVPSVLWLIAAVILGTARGREGLRQSPLLVLIGAAFLLAPLAYGVLQVVVGHRYLNLFLFWITMILLHQAAAWLASWNARVQWSAVAFVLVLAIVEILPFRPFQGAFRPFWLHYPDDHAAEVGRINPTWMGWGEEMLLAGEILQAREPGPMTLYCCYHSGAWIQSNPAIRQKLIANVGRIEEAGYGKRDYYVINRSIVVQGFALPEIEPDLTLTYRGFELGWAYQGRRLAEAGYTYDSSQRQFLRASAAPNSGSR